jgi:hypothetical protein
MQLRATNSADAFVAKGFASKCIGLWSDRNPESQNEMIS